MSVSTRPASATATSAVPVRHPLVARVRSHRRVVLVTGAVVAAILVVPSAMSPVARLTLAVFTVLLSLTAFTKANEVVVCTGALAALVLVGGSSVGDAVGSVTSHTIILLVAAFVVAAAARTSGLAERMAFAIGGRARTVDQLMSRITWVLIGTAFLVPSTSGRAALMLPVYLAFAERIDDRRVRRALAVLFPSAILLSAVASLFGAGAHLVMTELVVGFGEARLGYLEWAVYGLPFAIVSSFVALQSVRWMFLDRGARRLEVDLRRTATPWTRVERIVSVVLGTVTALWLTEPLHGVAAWIVAVAGAAVVTVGPFRALTLTGARRALPLDLLFVMAVTAEAGSALARTGAADWIALTLLAPLTERAGSTLAIVVVVALVSLLAHLVVTSRTARASVLLPVVILVGGAAGLDVTALAFLSTAAAGYCLTTTTSAKPIRVFATVEDGYDEQDLRRLSLRLLPIHVLLLLGFAFVVWPVLGLALGAEGGRTPTVVTDSLRTSGVDRGDRGDRAAALPWAAARIDGLGVGPRWAATVPQVDPDGQDDTPTTAPSTVPATVPLSDRDRAPDTVVTSPPVAATPAPTSAPTIPPTSPPTIPPAVPPTIPPAVPATIPPTAPAGVTDDVDDLDDGAAPAPVHDDDDDGDDDEGGGGDGDD